MLGRLGRLEVDDKTFHDQEDGLDVVLAGVVENRGLKQRPRKLLHRHDFAGQRVELQELREKGFRILVDERAPERLAMGFRITNLGSESTE